MNKKEFIVELSNLEFAFNNSVNDHPIMRPNAMCRNLFVTMTNSGVDVCGKDSGLSIKVDIVQRDTKHNEKELWPGFTDGVIKGFSPRNSKERKQYKITIEEI